MYFDNINKCGTVTHRKRWGTRAPSYYETDPSTGKKTSRAYFRLPKLTKEQEKKLRERVSGPNGKMPSPENTH